MTLRQNKMAKVREEQFDEIAERFRALAEPARLRILNALRDGERTDSSHDMGGDIIPAFVSQGNAGVYDLKRNEVPGSTDRDRYYWRDVGTIDSFFEAHQDLISVLPVFNLYNREWPIFSQQVNSPPAKFTRDARGSLGTVIDSIVSLGSVISGAHVERSVLATP